MTTAAIVPTHPMALARDDEEWSVARIVEQTTKIQQCMDAVMKRDEHYGVIPGTQGRDGKPAKPTLLKPGAEKLCLMFRLCPEYETLRAVQTSELVSYTIRCTLIHIPTGNRIATGLGSCNSKEKKYVRPADKKCPSCNRETIIKGKEEYGGGWLCYAKKGGCGAKYKDGDVTIEKQDTGVADPSDLDNTILKMGCKRSLVAAVLNGTAASDCFTQDLEDLATAATEYAPPAPAPAPVGPNVPVPNKNGRGSWPKHVPKTTPAEDASAAMDAEYAAIVRGEMPMSKEDHDVPQARILENGSIEVYDRETGEVTQQPAPSAPMMKKLNALRRELQIDDKAWRAGMQKYYSVDTSTLLHKAQVADFIDRLEITKEKGRKAMADVGEAISKVKQVFPNARETNDDEANRAAAAPTEGEGP